jgi:hypothetical protein
MAETVKAWQCIGCGRIDHPQPCLGICQDRKVELVYASEHEEALARLRVFESLARRIATITPRADEWERSYRALQKQAREALDSRPASAGPG